jgi:DNA-binding transcriptional regulator GbsR (MarR family)
MNSVQLSDQQKELIERMGVFYEQHGIVPIEARIMALLIVCDQPELTFDQIRELLGISKSATSNALNVALMTQRIIYKTRPGDRKRYFASNIVSWQENLSDSFQKMLGVVRILKEALEQRTSETPQFNSQLAEFIAFMEYLNAEFPRLFQEWRNKQKQI